MRTIHRFYEIVDENSGFLHDVLYMVKDSKVLALGIQCHYVTDGIVGERFINFDYPLNKVTLVASYSILFKDGVMDIDANYIEIVE
jgi:hypothetical protein